MYSSGGADARLYFQAAHDGETDSTIAWLSIAPKICLWGRGTFLQGFTLFDVAHGRPYSLMSAHGSSFINSWGPMGNP